MTAQFIPPAKPILGDDERKAVDEVIASGMVAQGPQVHAFEDEFSSQVVDGVHCVAVNSGTSAHLSPSTGVKPNLRNSLRPRSAAAR